MGCDVEDRYTIGFEPLPGKGLITNVTLGAANVPVTIAFRVAAGQPFSIYPTLPRVRLFDVTGALIADLSHSPISMGTAVDGDIFIPSNRYHPLYISPVDVARIEFTSGVTGTRLALWRGVAERPGEMGARPCS